MQLAFQAGRLDWRNALNEISLDEFIEWYALDCLDGVGVSRDDLRAAYQTSWLAAMHGQDVQPSEFLFDYHNSPEENHEQPDTMAAIAMGFGVSLPPRKPK